MWKNRNMLSHWVANEDGRERDERDRWMTQDEKWTARYNEVVTFIETNKRNPSKYDAEERGEYYTWLKHNRKQMNAGTMKPERVEKFKELLALCEQYKHKNQYE